MIAVTGDIHGCVRTLEASVRKITKRHKISRWYFLGDIIDRGPYSRETVEYLINLDKDIPVRLLLGNHEDLMLSYLYDDKRYPLSLWPQNGGGIAIKSYTRGRYSKSDAKRHHEAIYKYFEPHLPFYQSYLLYEELELGRHKYLLSHAGIYNHMYAPDEQDLSYPEPVRQQHPGYIWDKRAVYNTKGYRDYILLFGHTPICKTNLSKTPKKPYLIYNDEKKLKGVDLDTGCVYGYTLSTALLADDGSLTTISIECKDL